MCVATCDMPTVRAQVVEIDKFSRIAKFNTQLANFNNLVLTVGTPQTLLQKVSRQSCPPMQGGRPTATVQGLISKGSVAVERM